GRNIYPTLYEPEIVERADLADAAFVGVPDAFGDERVVLWVSPQDGKRPEAAAARARAIVVATGAPSTTSHGRTTSSACPRCRAVAARARWTGPHSWRSPLSGLAGADASTRCSWTVPDARRRHRRDRVRRRTRRRPAGDGRPRRDSTRAATRR